MSDQEAPSNILTGFQDVDRRICQLWDELTPWQRAFLRVLSDTPGVLSPAEWIVRAQRLAHNVMSIEAFVELRESLLVAGLVAGFDQVRYWATPLGRCVASKTSRTQTRQALADLELEQNWIVDSQVH